MTPAPPVATAVAMLAQSGDAIGGISAKAAGLLAQVAAGLVGVAVAWITIVLYWQLLTSMASSPSPSKVAMTVVVPLLAVFLVGATPDLLDAAYAYGQSFMTQ